MATLKKLTRREVAAALSASAALRAQAPAPAPQNADQELKAAREAIGQNSAQLEKVPVPMSVEPAVHFRA